jgi:hypothetical protein
VPGRGGKFELKAVFCQALNILQEENSRRKTPALTTPRAKGEFWIKYARIWNAS